MEELLKNLATTPDEVIATIKKQSKDFSKIEEYKKEFYKHDRDIRDSQIGKTQVNKTVKGKPVAAVRIPINFAKKIVNTSTAFEVGKPVTLIASEENELATLIYQTWKINRLDAAVQKLVSLKKTETQAALQFYITNSAPTSLINKILQKFGKPAQAKEIKTKVLDNSTGKMTPYFDGTGNMIAFMWEYATQNGEKTVNNVQIWDEKIAYNFSDENGSLAEVSKLPHGFDKIPVVYVSQEEPEWFDVKELIDRMETTLSKLGASNDYAGHPMLKIFGEVLNAPDKDEDGKAWLIPVKKDDEGREIKGDVEFLTADNSVESVKLEIETLLSFIYSISQTPDLSFDNLKGLGTVSGVALKLLFLDAIIKAMTNEGENRTMIERILNIVMSGITNTTNTKFAAEAKLLYHDIKFNSILPDDLKTASDIIITLKEAGLISSESAIKLLDMVEDPKAELAAIKEEDKLNKEPKTV